MRVRPRLPLALSALFVLACGGGDPATGGGPPAALVEVAPVRNGSLSQTWRRLGDVRALERAELAAGAAGAVSRALVREGDRVARGDLLLEVDPALAGARLERARAAAAQAEVELEQASRDLDRLRRVREGVLSAREVEAAEASLQALQARQRSLEAAAREAAVELERHRVRAPFDGVVTDRLVDPGEWVTPGRPVLRVVSSEAVEVHVDAPADLVGRVQAGHPARLSGRAQAEASVLQVVPALDPVARTARIRLAPDPAASWLLPGDAVEVVMEVAAGEGLVVPRDALVLGPVETRVVRVVDGAAAPMTVQVRATSGAEALVEGEGLAAGELLVTRGNERLMPGQPLRFAEVD